MGDYLDRVTKALADLELDEIAPLLTEGLGAGVETVCIFSGWAT